MGSGLRLPAPPFPCTRLGSFSRGGCFRRAAFGVTPHPVLTTRAFYASAFAVSQLVLCSNGVPKCRRVKRSLKLDDQFEENPFGPSKIMRRKSITAYSPTTGTYQLSPFSSPTTPKEQEHRNRPSNGTRKPSNLSSPARQESTVKGSDGFMMLLSKIERSSEKTMEIMKNLRSIQALEGNRQLEDLIGVSLVPCSLKREARKTKELTS
ncbi:centromere protein R isoform X3 [Arvicanthis niloticus]|uniref:centromere protein R isoform X3 n=1 Tax=Arvicanthis niloticus TaxID=61156 RepID=UPI00402B765D